MEDKSGKRGATTIKTMFDRDIYAIYEFEMLRKGKVEWFQGGRWCRCGKNNYNVNKKVYDNFKKKRMEE